MSLDKWADHFATLPPRRRDPRWRKLMDWRKSGGTGCRCEWCTGSRQRAERKARVKRQAQARGAAEETQ